MRSVSIFHSPAIIYIYISNRIKLGMNSFVYPRIIPASEASKSLGQPHGVNILIISKTSRTKFGSIDVSNLHFHSTCPSQIIKEINAFC